MKYKHLSQAERYQIYALMKAGHDQTQIRINQNQMLMPSCKQFMFC
jgi:IS30 family transposase